MPDPAQLVRLPDQLLQVILDGVVELQPAAVEDLEPVVVGRVVRGGDHDPTGERATTGQEGKGRASARRHLVDVHAEARRTGRDRCHEHVAGPPGVLPDDERATTVTQVLGGRPPEGVGQRRLEVHVGDPADPVGTEESWHWFSLRWEPATGRRGVGSTTSTVTLGGLDVTRVRPVGQRDRDRDSVPPARVRRHRGRPRSSPRSGDRGRRSSRRSSAAPDRWTACRSGPGRSPIRRRPALYVRVDVTGRSVTVTRTASAPSGTTPVGRSSATVADDVGRGPGHGDRLGIELGQLGELVGVALDRDHAGSTLDRAISNPAAGVPVTTGVDRQRPALAIGEDRDGHPWPMPASPRSGRTALPTPSTGMSGTSVSKSMPARVDDHVGADRGHLVDGRFRAGHGDARRLDGRLTEIQTGRQRADARP